MARVYTVVFDQQTIAAASGDVDFFELRAADDKPIELLALFLGNKSEIGDAMEEQVAYAIVRGNATTGTGGATPTPNPLVPGDAAAGFAADTCNTAIATAGTPLTLHADTFNIRTGLQLIVPPTITCRTTEAGGFLCVRLLTALADDATFSGTAYVMEH